MTFFYITVNSRVSDWNKAQGSNTQHGVAAWVAAQLQVGCDMIDQPGRVYFADDSAEHSILVERMLQPVFLQVPRNGHALCVNWWDLFFVKIIFQYGKQVSKMH